ncbi:class I SAM-dependent methyltransferase [Alkalihalobacillus hemicellulosilyticus]|nr:class I SAM-dependent methyltransferase [Halalkalibacter hemicellulosilyticus]
MKQNKYDDQRFFDEYAKMPRSILGLEGAGEWHVLESMLPSLENKAVLDLGCGYGWHCRYAHKNRASKVVGVDLSKQMLKKAAELTDDSSIIYIQEAIEEINFDNHSFDVVISSLAFHYIKDFYKLSQKIYDCMKKGGHFVFSVEHPIFTAREEQDWIYNEEGTILHWPIDNYQLEGLRQTNFLADNVIKYHRTVSTYVNDLIQAGFRIRAIKEPMPTAEWIERDPNMKHELRRPMFFILAVEK